MLAKVLMWVASTVIAIVIQFFAALSFSPVKVTSRNYNSKIVFHTKICCFQISNRSVAFGQFKNGEIATFAILLVFRRS